MLKDKNFLKRKKETFLYTLFINPRMKTYIQERNTSILDSVCNLCIFVPFMLISFGFQNKGFCLVNTKNDKQDIIATT